MIDNQLKNCTMAIDGRGYAGRVKTVTLPKLTVKTEEFRGGGMDAPIEIDMGMEKLEFSATLSSVDPDLLGSWGLAHGRSPSITVRGAPIPPGTCTRTRTARTRTGSPR